MPWDDEHARRQVVMAEELLAGLDALPDSAAAARAAETVETLVGLYGQCLARVVDQLAKDGDTLRRLAADELVGHLLLVHDLHPDPVETRVRAALEGLPGGAELLELSGASVRVGVGGGCGSAGAEEAVREAVAARAPEIENVEVVTGNRAEPLIPVDALFRDRAPVREGVPAGDRAPMGREAG
jgi:hypothetical protein